MSREPDAGEAARRAAMDELYAQLPTMQCRGQCWDSCGPLGMSGVEERRLSAAGTPIPNHANLITHGGAIEPMVCPALNLFNACSVYEMRPMICRLWGLVDNLPCEFGCRPEGGRLSVADGYEFLARAADIDGRPDLAAAIRQPFSTPDLAAQSTRIALALNQQLRDDFEHHRAAVRGSGGLTLQVLGRGRFTTRP